MRLKLNRKQRRVLNRFLTRAQGKGEFRRGTGVLMRSRRRKVKEIARELTVSVDAVERWLRSYRRLGIEGLKSRKKSGRLPKIKDRAKGVIEGIMKHYPQAFGFLKGRWVVRDIARALSREAGITISQAPHTCIRSSRSLGLHTRGESSR